MWRLRSHDFAGSSKVNPQLDSCRKGFGHTAAVIDDKVYARWPSKAPHCVPQCLVHGFCIPPPGPRTCAARLPDYKVRPSSLFKPSRPTEQVKIDRPLATSDNCRSAELVSEQDPPPGIIGPVCQSASEDDCRAPLSLVSITTPRPHGGCAT